MASKLRLAEAIVDAAVAKLQNGMAARVATVNSDYNDGIAIAAPDNNSYYKSGIESIPVAPAIIVSEGQADFRQGEGVHSFMPDTKLRVYVLDQDASRQNLGKRLQRLARAVIETLWDDPPQERLDAVAPFAGQTAAFRVMPEQTIPGRVFEPQDPDEWRGLYLVIFDCQSFEPAS